MPISAIAGCDERHWLDVKAILKDAIEAAGFQTDLVSFANESRIIQNTIVENLNQNDVIVCDVSCKNPNVMFELGMRLAFDLPTIVVKDEVTDYSFDTSPIVHLQYPRSLRYANIVAFKQELTEIVRSTHKAAKGPNFKSFLKTFGPIKVAKLERQEVPREDFILGALNELRQAVARLNAPRELSAEELRQGYLYQQYCLQGTDDYSLSAVVSESANRVREAYPNADPITFQQLVRDDLSARGISIIPETLGNLLSQFPMAT